MRTPPRVVTGNTARPPAVVLALLIALAGGAGAARAQGKARLERIEVRGLKLLREEAVVEASGLKLGEPVDAAVFDAAAERLLASGLVSKVGYRVREASGAAVVTFDVTETTRVGEAPVVFDNFVWFTREELLAAVRRQLPTFEGRATQATAVTEAVKRGLAGLLRERGIPGEVEYMLSTDAFGRGERLVFSVKGAPSLDVCAVGFPGAAGVAEKELAAAASAQSIVGQEYSQEAVAGFADVGLRAMYHERGYLKVEFGEPRGTLVAGDGACKSGVSVTLPVREGVVYAWAGAEWAGNATIPAAQLDAALGMKPGEVANGKKIERALMEVRKAYGRKGYIEAGVRPQPEFDDEARRVRFRYEVREGTQYRMGALSIVGLSEPDAERLRGRWRLKSGDVYHADYVQAFLRDATPSLARPGARAPQVGIKVTPDRAKGTADVTLTFGAGTRP